MVNVLLPRPTAFECRSERDLKGLAPSLPVMDKLTGPMMSTRIAATAAVLLMALALLAFLLIERPSRQDLRPDQADARA